jgi:hypothetical protein
LQPLTSQWEWPTVLVSFSSFIMARNGMEIFSCSISVYSTTFKMWLCCGLALTACTNHSKILLSETYVFL